MERDWTFTWWYDYKIMSMGANTGAKFLHPFNVIVYELTKVYIIYQDHSPRSAYIWMHRVTVRSSLQHWTR